MKYLLATLFLISLLSAQVSFTKFPEDLQLYARNLETDSATVQIEGTVNSSGVSYTSVLLKIHRSDTLVDSLSQLLIFLNNTAAFSFTPQIKAELANYSFVLYGVTVTGENLEKKAEKVCAGDAFIIQGQSNAQAMSSNGDANVNQGPFIRVFGSADTTPQTPMNWFLGEGNDEYDGDGNTGQWGLRLARLIVDNHNIPVAIFNGALGGRPVQYFQRNEDNPATLYDNYGRLLIRLNKSGLKNHIRGIFWHQGEGNAGSNATHRLDTEGYKTYWNALYNDWMEDIPSVTKTYIFQIRSGCFSTIDRILQIKEAHRQLALETDNVEIMSTSGVQQHTDKCHYAYETGYKLFGEHIYRLVNRDFYNGVAEADIEPPQVLRAERTGDREITLVMDNADDTYTWDTGAETELTFTGASVSVTSVTVDGRHIKLGLSGNASGITAITFRGHDNTPEPMVRNANGIGAVHFNQLPVTEPVFTSYKQNTQEQTLSFYKTGSIVTIEFSKVLRFNKAQIVNTHGRVVKTFPKNQDQKPLKWDAQKEQKGVYYFQVTGSNNATAWPMVLF
ncbi:MAG: hypothetical protein HQK83_09425 [Fibrobacteria bacterium]|nr:hypothetical protein [Fibrobacteria bacterium]